MKSMVLGAKVALSSHKDTNPEYERRVASTKGLGSALASFDRAVNKIKAATKEAMESLDAIAKAYQEFIAAEGTNEQFVAVVRDFDSTIATLRNTALGELMTSIDHSVVPPVAALKRDQGECKTLEGERDKLFNEYMVYKEAVEKKEADYARKGKDLGASKAHSEEVQKRDAAKSRVDEIDAKYVPKCDDLLAAKDSVTLTAFTDLCRGLSTLFTAIASEMTRLKGASSNVKLA